MNSSALVEYGPTIFQTAMAAIGVIFVLFEFRRNTNLSKAQLIFNLNQQLSSYDDVVSKLSKIGNKETFDKLDDYTMERLFDYISIFETIEGMCQLKTLRTIEVDYFFSGRFSTLIGNQTVRDEIFFNDEIGGQFYPVFSLVRRVIDWRTRRRRSTSNDEKDKRYENYLSFREHNVQRYQLLSSRRIG